MSTLEPDTKGAGTVKEKWIQPPPRTLYHVWADEDPDPPSAALTLTKKARAHGWEAVATYAQGVHAPKRGTTDPVITHSCVVRLSRGIQWAYSAWEAPHAEPLKWSSVSTATVIGWLAPDGNGAGTLAPIPLSLTSTQLSDLVQSAELTQKILFDDQHQSIVPERRNDFMPFSKFMEFLTLPAILRAETKAERAAKKVKAHPDALASLTATDFTLTKEDPS